MKKMMIMCICIIIILSTGCSKAKARYQAQFLSLFDTVTTIVGYSDSKEEFTLLAERIKSTLNEYHQLYDIYNDYENINNIKTINDNAGLAPVKVNQKIIEMLEFSKEQYTTTSGAVNVAFGSVLSIWHKYRDEGLADPINAKVPPMELLEQASLHTNINDVIIDKDASTVFLKDPLMRLDVGAIAKGYATEQTALYYENEGITSLLLSVGGNVRAIGGKSAENNNDITPWHIGIQNPDKDSSDTELMSVEVYDSSLVSSGVYERYYTVGEIRYHHIIDPDTLMPSQYFAAVSILCPDSGQADALSTAIFNMSLSEGMEYIKSHENTEAVWIFSDGSMEYSDGFMDYVIKE